MNILIIGGCSSLINNLIIKLNKEGHRVYLLTGSRNNQEPYQKVFERYHFPYNSSCLSDIFESIRPDVTIFMGAYDTNFDWKEEDDAVKYAAGITNILMSYAMTGTGKFIYLSSQEVFEDYFDEDITEEVSPRPRSYKGIVLAQAEELCESHRKNLNRDIVVLRMEHVFSMPDSMKDVTDPCTKMCLEALERSVITVNENHTFSLLYATDAIEIIYRFVTQQHFEQALYNVTAPDPITERELAELIRKNTWFNIEIVATGKNELREVLSGTRLAETFGNLYFCDRNSVVQKIAEHMKKYRRSFLYGEKKKKKLSERLYDEMSDLLRTLFPFLENFVTFFVALGLSQLALHSTHFKRLDFYLLYVLLFGMVYGQQQAIISATLGVLGYLLTQLNVRSGFELMLDSSTYIWIAQLYILGLTVGYMRDMLNKLKREQISEREFMTMQLGDIKDINDSNVRVKDALEAQLVNQNNSVGKIYRITSALDRYSPEEVLFYAAETVAQLMKCEDVVIYSVSSKNSDYARLFSSTSNKARMLGNSIRFREMGELSEALEERKVYINRLLDEHLPLMATAVYDEAGDIQVIIMLWGLTWENMTLGQANQLVIISSLIGNAMVRANKYLAVLENERYVGDTKLMETEAFTELVNAYVGAEKRGYTFCTVLQIRIPEGADLPTLANGVAEMLRQHDYVGTFRDGRMCVLLSNIDEKGAAPVIQRLKERGYESIVLEESEY